MQTAATRSPSSSSLAVAFELGNTTWMLACAPDPATRPLLRTLPARALPRLTAALADARAHFGLPATAPVVSCYEAGRDGFWLDRWLHAQGIANHVIDSASIEVDRRRRRTKTDRLDATQLLRLVLRVAGGEPGVWRAVHVPSPAAEDQRQLHRELLTVRRERARLTNRLKGLLAAQGIVLEHLRDLPTQLATLHTGDGAPLPPYLTARLTRDWDLRAHYTARLQALRAERDALLRTSDAPAIQQVRQLATLRGVGRESAWLYVMEFFAWRGFTNRRQVGGLAGLTDTAYQSGELAHQQGISKAGNRWVRALAINSAWAWLRYQPASALAVWYQQRFATGGSRARKRGIVALARKLLIAFWRYLATGEVPAGAVLRG